MKKVLVAGATGYLGRYLVRALNTHGHQVRALARNPEKLDDLNGIVDQVIQAEITQADTLKGICQDVDVVISSIGITRQKDGLKYMDVDYQANKNLLDEAINAGVKKFIYVSVLNGPLFRDLKMIEAKERFADELISSGIDYAIIRPNGFFSDITEVLNMAREGKVYLIGDGLYKSNPIHGQDLAEFIVDKMNSTE
ncbi:MAG: SDR family oxidoreductase, partial [Cyclobacteriaceae bacterium]